MFTVVLRTEDAFLVYRNASVAKLSGRHAIVAGSGTGQPFRCDPFWSCRTAPLASPGVRPSLQDGLIDADARSAS